MKRTILTLGVMAFGFFVKAQSQEKVDSTYLKNWMHSNFEDTGVYGVNTQKALDFLKEHYRKPQNIVVGVLDSGVEYFHEDLKNNIWVNPKEKVGNRKDDDGNGFIDDLHGWNFVTDKNGVSYAKDSYELTRQYAKLNRFWKEKGHLLKNPQWYQHYLKIKKEYFSKVFKISQLKDANESKINFLKPRLEALNKGFEGVTLTKNLVENFNSDDALAMEGLVIFSELKENEWVGKTMPEVVQYYLNRFEKIIHYTDEQLEYSFNPNYDPQEGNPKNYGNNDIKGLSDDHGTHVAGIIAGEWGNSKGINGTSGGNYVKIMGVRVVPDGDERDRDVANGIRYAVDNGAKILNMSFGKSVDDNSKLVIDAIKYAESKNVLIVKAAGNDNVNVDITERFPVNLINGEQFSKSVITVGANTRFADKLKAKFSNYGKKSVDVFAPGQEIYSTVPGGNKYKFLNGTSMASPVVAGVAALIWSHYPKLSANDIKNILIETTNKNTQLQDISVSGGVVDSYKAVQKAEELYKKIENK